MEKETKKYLIIGTTIVVSVGIGVLLWKKYQTASAASGAAADQSNQDELSLLAASLESNAYAGQAGFSNYSPAVIGAGTPKTLAEEVLALEQELGIAPASTSPSAPAPTASGGNAPTPAPAPSHRTPAPAQDGHYIPEDSSEMIRYNHGAPLFEMDGVRGEGVLVS